MCEFRYKNITQNENETHTNSFCLAMLSESTEMDRLHFCE